MAIINEIQASLSQPFFSIFSKIFLTPSGSTNPEEDEEGKKEEGKRKEGREGERKERNGRKKRK